MGIDGKSRRFLLVKWKIHQNNLPWGGGGSDNKWNIPIRREENKVESSKDDFFLFPFFCLLTVYF